MTGNLATKQAFASLETASLKDALDKFKMVVERRNTIPILDQLLVTSDKGTLFLTGTDLDIDLTIALQANVEAGLFTTVPTHRLWDVVKSAPKGSITTLTPTVKNHILVDFGGPALKVNNLSAVDFPTDCVKIKDPTSHTIPGHAFFDGLDATSFAISTEETRYYLNGIFLHDHEGELRMVTTDGHRLALQPIGVQGVEFKGIVPRKTVKILHKLLKGKACPKDLTLEVSKTPTIRLQWGNITLATKLIDGTFPDYHRVIPQDHFKLEARIDSEALIAGVNQVKAISDLKSPAVKLVFTGGNKLQLLVNHPESGSATYDLPVSYEWLDEPAESLEIGFNSGYLIDLANIAGKGELTFKIQDPGSPARVTGSRNKEWLAVLMPMRV